MRLSSLGVRVASVEAESLDDDTLDALDVDEVEAERAPASCIHALRPVLVDESEEFLTLPQLGPREIPRKQQFGEFAAGGSSLLRALDDAVGIAHGVRGILRWVVLPVGIPTSGRHPRVSFDELTAVIDAYEPRITAYRDLRSLRSLTVVRPRYRVQREAEANVVVRVNFRLAPFGSLEALSLQGFERCFLVSLELREGVLASRAVDACASGCQQ